MKTKALLRLSVLSLSLLLSLSSFAAWDIFQSYIIIDSGSGNEYRAGGINADVAPSFDGHYYGAFYSGDTFILNGGELKTYKNSGSNVCNGDLYYRIYRTCDTPPATFSNVDLPFDSDLGGGDQKWDEVLANVDLLSGLESGSYVIEVYWSAEGNDTGGCGQFKFDGNGGANWKAYFDYEQLDSFTDGDFSANPAWSGDTGAFTVDANSDAGAGATGSNTLHLNTTGAGTQYISTAYSSWDLNQTWSFFFGRRGNNLTAANNVAIWLYANESNLESATVDGYRLFIGDNSGGDDLILQAITDNAVSATVITSSVVIPNTLTDYGLAIKVRRDGNGNFEIFSSALPAADGDGVIASDCPLVDATTSRGSGTNTDYTPTGTGYFGFVMTHGSSGAAPTAQEFDQIRIKGDQEGCTDNTACNYLPGATVNVGCDYSCLGCTDSGALNYDAGATVDDGSCTYPDLVITEILYNPDDVAGYPDADYEFIEIYNNESFSVDITGYVITGISCTFPATTTIAPGEYIVVALNDATYTGNGYQVFDATGGLSNAGETVTIESPNGYVVDSVAYDDASPWPAAADGSGPSLELTDVNSDNNDGSNWVATTINGTPGAAPSNVDGCTDPSATNYDVSATNDDGSCTYGSPTIVITELHYNPCGDQGNDGDFEFLELYNATASAIDVSDWEILGFEFTFPASSSIGAGEYVIVVTNGGASNYTGSYQVFELTAVGAAMANAGEAIALLDDLGNYIDYVSYMPASPWPTGANGGCSSLELSNTSANNNDPSNWQDSYTFGGTPGTQNSSLYECTECGDLSAVSVNILSEDWEAGALTNWTESTSGDWIADDTNPIAGTYSLKHNLSTGSGSSHITNDMDCMIYTGTCTNWQFQVENGAWDPSATDRFLVYLGANEADLQSATVDGYAVGINYGATDDFIALYYMVDGAVSSTIMSSNIDINASSVLGVQVTRDPNGSWMLALDVNGGFDNLFNVAGSGVSETSMAEGRYFGVRFDYTASSVGSLWVDDITVSQCGIETTYYSVSSGNSGDAIWSEDDLAVTGESLGFNRFRRLVVQDGHTVTLNGNVIADDISTESTGTLDGGSGNYELALYGNFINDGTFTHGNSNIIMKGNSAQLIAGANPLSVYDLTIDCGTTVTLAQTVTLINILYPNKGTLASAGNLVIHSDASTSAYIAPVGDEASITGDAVHIEYLQASTLSPTPSGWGYVSAVTTGLTIEDWDDDIITTGIVGSDAPLTDFKNIYYYDETVAGTQNNGYTFFSNVTDALDPNRGYFLYEFNGALSIDQTGPVRQGDITVDISHTNNEGTAADGWNLLTNVYAAPVDIEALVSNSDPDPSSGTQTAMLYYIWSQSTGSYTVYQAVTGLGNGSRYLAPYQPFYTRVDATHFDLAYGENVKDVTQSGLNIVRNELVIPTITASINNEFTQDQVFVAFRDDTNAGLDAWDAPKLSFNEVPQACTAALIAADGEELVIDSRPLPGNESMEIPVRITALEAGTYSFSIDEIEDMPAGMCLIIENLISGEILPLNEGTVIDLELDAEFNDVALVISAKQAAQFSTDAVSCYDLNDGRIEATANGEGNFNFEWTNENSEVVLTESGNTSVLEGLAFGTYYLEITSDDMICEVEPIAVNIDQPDEEIFTTNINADICNATASGEILIEVENVEEYNYSLYQNSELILSESLVLGDASISSLNAGIYEVEIITGCNQILQEVNLNDVNAVTAEFEAPTQVIMSNGLATVSFENLSLNGENYFWTMGDGSTSNATTPQHTYTEAGTYEVELIASNSNCSNTVIHTIEILEEVVGVYDLDAVNVYMSQNGADINLYLNGVQGMVQVELFDMTGRVLLSESFSLSGSDMKTISTAMFSSGIYQLRVSQGDNLIFTGRMKK